IQKSYQQQLLQLISSSSLFSTPPMTTAPQTRTSSDPDIALKPIVEHQRHFFNLLKM
ncbi:unnamed protein product, partial [Rotaria sp. Silwood1]